MRKYYTSRAAPQDKDGLRAYRAGATWVYADSVETFRSVSATHSQRIVKILSTHPLIQFGFLCSVARKDKELAEFEREYIRFLSNLACATGEAEKILCCPSNQSVYACFVSVTHSLEVSEKLQQLADMLDRSGHVRYNPAAKELYGGTTGSYFWVKSLLEHLVYLGIARSYDEWGVIC